MPCIFPMAARSHIEEIRRNKFSIGVGANPNPLTDDLHSAVKNLSAELYAKDVHFLMELIQNAEDNQYPAGIEPSIEFVLTLTDITGTGAAATLVIFNNEIGFSKNQIESICSIGRSTKKGKRTDGFIGEKGIGFKSVFLISKMPHIFSNGYQIRFNEDPNQDCGVGYIVPEWVDSKPSVSDIQRVYGSQKDLPTTIIILPLRSEKVQSVKKQLSEVHPELLLFLSKIKRLSVREYTDDHGSENTLCSISITSRTELVEEENGSATSCYVQLSAQEGTHTDSWYYLWKQVFPVKPENKDNGRQGVDEWAISLAFPIEKRLNKGTACVGIYAFIPTAMVTNFPFIIQGDFILASSRESILLDNKWNLGILDCVPCIIRETIREMLQEKMILPYESYTDKPIDFCKPIEVVRLLPDFRKILADAKEEGLPLEGVSSKGRYILHHQMDVLVYDEVLKFLRVRGPIDDCGWYSDCIKQCNLVLQLSEDIYIDLLCFVMDNMERFSGTSEKPFDAAVLKYVRSGKVSACSIGEAKIKSICISYAHDSRVHDWLCKWNQEFESHSRLFFMANSTQRAFVKHGRKFALLDWLHVRAGILPTTIFTYNENLFRRRADSKTATLFAHFIYHSYRNKFLKQPDVYALCLNSLPIVDGNGVVHSVRNKTLVPASGSKWAHLFNVNPFKMKCYVELGERYADRRMVAGECAEEKSFLAFMKKYTQAMDLPELQPPDIELPILDADLTSEQVFLLLDWIQYLKYNKSTSFPMRFIRSISKGRWLKVTEGFDCPNKSYFYKKDIESALCQLPNPIKTLSLIDVEYYGGEFNQYRDVLETLGVRSLSEEEVYRYILSNFKFPPSFTDMSKDDGILLLQSLQRIGSSDPALLEKVKSKPWMKTIVGNRYPSECILHNSKMGPFSGSVEIPFIDEAFYGHSIRSFMSELEDIGVAVDLDSAANVIVCWFKSLLSAGSPTCRDVILLLNCINFLSKNMLSVISEISDCLVDIQFIKTRHGYKSPPESVLFDSKWGMICQFVDLPLIDDGFYGLDIYKYKSELALMHVIIDLAEGFHLVEAGLRLPEEPGDFTSEAALMLLQCIHFLMKKSSDNSLPESFLEKIRVSRWLKTHMGYRAPKACMLFDHEWDCKLRPTDAAFLDDNFYGSNLYSYREQLKAIEVKVETDDICWLVYKNLASHVSHAVIVRIYSFFNQFRWKPLGDGSHFEVWIPDKDGSGSWVKSKVCVIHDKGNLFSMTKCPIHVLDNYYQKPLLQFFSFAFEVPLRPSISDYIALWNSWELNNQHEITLAECCSFWECIFASWNLNTDVLKENIKKLPTAANSEGKIYLKATNEVFIPDDIELEALFTAAIEEPLFVWYPPQTFPSIPIHKLCHAYSSLGVKKLSELVNFGATSLPLSYGSGNLNLKRELLSEGLLRIVLGFFAGPRARMPLEKRQDTVSFLLNLAVHEINKPALISYMLEFPSGRKKLEVKASRIVFWEKRSHELFVHKRSYEESKTSIEFTTYFSRAVSNILTQETPYLTNDLCKLIQLGVSSGLNEEVVKFMLKTENLQLFTEDEEFISSSFPLEPCPPASRLQFLMNKRKPNPDIIRSHDSQGANCKRKKHCAIRSR